MMLADALHLAYRECRRERPDALVTPVSLRWAIRRLDRPTGGDWWYHTMWPYRYLSVAQLRAALGACPGLYLRECDVVTAQAPLGPKMRIMWGGKHNDGING